MVSSRIYADPNLVERFFNDARDAVLNKEPLHVDEYALTLIARNQALRNEFRSRFKALNDQDLAGFIREHIVDYRDALQDVIDDAMGRVELFDKGAIPISASATGAGIVALIGSAVAGTFGIAGLLLLAGGGVGLAAAAWGSMRLRGRTRALRSDLRKVENLLELL
ncbi:MAG: hypothetical protein P4M09_30585 [Devosia sp.]|nr:hypothetical protein [Devosia sp.]